jgi:glycosyltransferase involved in cell wall biosynthesis
MRFSVDAHAIGRRLTGNEVYIRNLLAFLAEVDKQVELVAYVSTKEANRWVPPGVKTKMVSSNPFLRLGCDLSLKLRQDRPELVHVQYTAPLGCPVPVVVTVHDVSFVDHPEYFSRARAVQLRLTVRRTVLSAAKVLTGSEFSRRSIIKAYGLNDEKVVVIPNAAARCFRPLPPQTTAASVAFRFGITSPYVLMVGDHQPRKNQVGLVRAFADLLRTRPELPHHLLMAGKESGYTRSIGRAIRDVGLQERVHLLGFVSDEELVELYNGCELFVFPSFYEGFGLPVLEAMACGRAVACSNASALPEVADAAALLFDPFSTAEMTRAMLDLILDPELRRRMEKEGLRRAARFSWQKTAEQTLGVYKLAASVREKLGRRSAFVATVK